MARKRTDRNLSKGKFCVHGAWRYVLTAFYLTSSGGLLWAQPQDPAVISGQALLNQVDQNTLQIQALDRTILNWREFSIGEKECTQFLQPNKHAVVLNRVMGKGQSLIDGKLQANGKIYLINRNGIIVGPKGIIDASGFIASSLDVLDADFLSKGELLFSGDSLAKVENFGRIEAAEGDVVFIGYYVENQGVIKAPKGAGILAAGSEVLLRLEGEESIAVHAKKGIVSRDGTGIQNEGMIDAIRAELKADGNLYAMAINHTGNVQALGVVEKQGRVLLVADQGTTSISGNIAAKNRDGTGGEVHLLGNTVHLTEQASIDVSGEQGGGSLLIGGDFQGHNPAVVNAEKTFVGKEVHLRANALQEGHGGRVIIWADGETHFHGSIEAKGGVTGGDGGFAEVSGKKLLDFKGTADLTAPSGKVGTLLLDPTDLVISAATATANVSYPSPLIEPNAQVPISYLLFSDLQTQLGLSNVTVQTLPDTVTPASSAGDITWEDNADVSNPNAPVVNTNLVINAYRDFNMGAAYSNNLGTGNVVINAGRDINFLSLAAVPISQPNIHNNFGDTTLIAGRDVNLTATQAPVNVSGVDTSIQAGGNINILAGPAGVTNDVNVTGNNLTIEAMGDIICKGGAGTSSQVQLISQFHFNLTSNQGDIILEAGTAGAGIAGIHVSSVIDLEMQAKTGSIRLQGNADNVTVFVDQDLNLFAGQDLILIGGTGPSTAAMILSVPLGFPTHPLNIKVGGNCILEGGTGAATLATPTGGFINGNSGVNLDVGKNLILIGGPNDFNIASITTQLGDINLNVGNDITLVAGQGNGAFTQIGGSYLGTSGINININSFDGNLTLTGSTAGVTGAYALIGNGGQTTVPGPSTGEITISGGTGSRVFLNGGSGLSNFAQIGHPNYASSTISGNIRLANIGNDVTLTANPGSYALIGHGTDAFSAQSIIGSITLDAIGGDVRLNTANGSFTQIGHVNCQSLTQGDVVVNAPTGTISLLAATLGGGSAIIGHGNFLSPLTTQQFQGQITVNAGQVDVVGGIAPQGDAVIGFSVGQNNNVNVNILPPSSVTVSAQNNILVQGGTPTFNTGANGIIGFFSSGSSLNGSITLDDVRVSSAAGDITVVGGLGTAFIGTQASNPNFNTICQSNITIEALQGDLFLAPSFTGGGTGTGNALIANGNLFGASPFFPVPYDITINVDSLVMSGVPEGSQGSGSAQIFSSRNLDVRTLGDLVMNIPFGAMNASFCTIYNAAGVMTFDIGANVELFAGFIPSSFVRIGNTPVFPGTRDIIFKEVGGNVTLIGSNTTTQCFAQIGHTATSFLTPIIGQIIFDHIGGTLSLTGGTNLSNQVAGSFAQIGHNVSSTNPPGQATLSGDVIITEVEGPIKLTAGTDTFTYALIGHSLSNAGQGTCSGEIFVEGNSITLQGTTTVNTGTTPDNAIIGFATFLSQASVASTQIHASALNSITLAGGYAGNNFGNPGGQAIIGIFASQSTSVIAAVDKLNVSSTNGDVVLNCGVGVQSGTFSGNSVIGFYHPFASTPDNAVIQNIEVRAAGGNITLTGGVTGFQSAAFIGTLTNSMFANTLAASNIAIQAPLGTLSLTGLSSSTGGGNRAQISNVTNTFTTAANYDVAIDVGNLLLTGTIPGVMNFGGASIFSNRNLDVHCSHGSDLILIAGHGFATINANGIMTFDISGNVELFGGDNLALPANLYPCAQIGNSTSTADATGDIIFQNIGGSLNLNGGSVQNAFARIGHGNPTSSKNITGQVIINQVGGDIFLYGGSDTTASAYAHIGHYGADMFVFPFPTVTGDLIINNTDGAIHMISGLIGYAGGAPNVQFNGQVLVQVNTINMLGNGTAPTGVITTGNSTIGFDLAQNASINSQQVQVSALHGIALNGADAGTNAPTVLGTSTIGLRGDARGTIGKLAVSSITGDIQLTAGVPTSNPGGNSVIGYYNPLSNPFTSVTISNIGVTAANGNIALVGGNNDPTNFNAGAAFIGTLGSSTVLNVVTQSQIAIDVPLGNLSLSCLPILTTTTAVGGNALITNNFIGGLSPFDVSIDAESITFVGVPLGVANGGGQATVYSSRNLDMQTRGDLIMEAGGGTTNHALVNIGNGSGVMTFDIGGNVELDSGTSVVQIGNATTFGTSDLLFKNIGGNLFITGGSGPPPAQHYAQIGHGSLGTTTVISQSVQGQIVIDHIGGDLTLTGGSVGGNNYAQIGHADNGTGANNISINGDVIINDVQGTVNLFAGSGGGIGAIIGHSANSSANVNTYSGKVIVKGNAIRIEANNDFTPSATIGYDVLNTNGTITSAQIQASADGAITLTGGNAQGGTFASGDVTIGVHNALLATIEKLDVFSATGDILLSGGIPTNSGNQGGNAVIGYYNHNTNSVVNILFQNIRVGSASGNIVLTGGNGTQSTIPNPNPSGTAFIGTSTGSANGTLAVSNVSIQAPLGNLALSGAPFNNNIVNFGLAAIANVTNQTIPPVPSNFDISIDVGKLVLTGTYQGSFTTQFGQALINAARNLDVRSATDLLMISGTGFTNIANGNGTMTFDIGANLELIAGFNTSGVVNASAQIGSTFGTFVFTSDMIFKNVQGDLTLTAGTGANPGSARIGHSSFNISPISGRIVLDQVGGNVTLNSPGNVAQIGHFGTNVNTTGDVVIDNVDGLLQVNGGVIGHSGAGNGAFSGQVLVQATSVNLANGTSTIGYEGAINVSSSQIQVTAQDGITLNGGTDTDATIGVHNSTGAIIGKLNVSSTNGDITLAAGTPGAGTGGNAVIGYLNLASPSVVTINNLNVNSNYGNIFLVGGIGSGTEGNAFIGTAGANANAQSQVAINALNGALNLYGLPIGSTTVSAGRALIANVAFGNSVPFDVSINVDKALLVGSPTGTIQQGISQIYSGRNLNFVATGDLFLTANTGSSAISNGNGRMNFTVDGNVELRGGSGATSVAQIGNNSPANGVTSTILFNTIGGNLFLQGGTSPNSHAIIGHFETAGGNALSGDVLVNAVGGNVTLHGGTLTDTQAQIGHYGQTTSSISGDVTLNQVSGNIVVTGGNGVRTAAIIGHGGRGMSHTYSGQVLVQGTRVNLQGGTAGGSATIGFDDTSASPTIDSTQVQVSAPTAITLKAGIASNAVIGFYNTAVTGNVVIDNVNVLSTNGDIILNPGTGADAVIGTQLGSGISRSNIKITTSANILLQNPTGSTGRALIINNLFGASGATNISLDPGNIILLSNNGATPGFVQIYSGNNLDINFMDRFDINYDANNPAILQTGTAQVLANGDITINTSQASRGNITIQGPSSNQTTQISSTNGNITIGTVEEVGAQNLTIGTGNAGINGIARVFAPSGDIFINTFRNITLNGSTGNAAQLIAAGEIIAIAGRDLTLGSNSIVQNTGSFPLKITIGNDLNIAAASLQARITSPGLLTVQAGRDINMSTNGIMQSTGSYPLQAMAGNNINLSSNANLSQTAGGELTAVANRNMVLNGAAAVTTVGNNLTLVVDNLWPDPSKFGTGFFSLANGVTVSAAGGRVRIFTSRRPLNTISAPINGSAFAPGTIYVNTTSEQWQTYWDSSFGDPPIPFTIFYKDTTPPSGPADCVNVCNFPNCVDVCNFPSCVDPCNPPTPPNPPTPTPPPPNSPLTTRDILEKFDPSFFEAFQDWRTYDYFLFTPVLLAVNQNCCDYAKQLFPSINSADSCQEVIASIDSFGPLLSCQEMEKEKLNILRPEHRNYHTKKLEIIR